MLMRGDWTNTVAGPLIPAHAGIGLFLFSLWTFAPSDCAIWAGYSAAGFA